MINQHAWFSCKTGICSLDSNIVFVVLDTHDVCTNAQKVVDRIFEIRFLKIYTTPQSKILATPMR